MLDIVIRICCVSLFLILVCWVIGFVIDLIKQSEKNSKISFSERHSKLNLIIGLLLVTIIVALIWLILCYAGNMFINFVDWLSDIASKMDAVVIVALITGTVSIIGVIISSIIAKIIDYRKSRQEYLAKKREIPYGEYVEMIYKIQQNSKNEGSYTEEMMFEDLSKFSKQITLWGSSKVVDKWVAFRENGANPDNAKNNLFVLEDIMNEMRKDLGLKKVKKGNLLAFFVNDIKKML